MWTEQKEDAQGQSLQYFKSEQREEATKEAVTREAENKPGSLIDRKVRSKGISIVIMITNLLNIKLTKPLIIAVLCHGL